MGFFTWLENLLLFDRKCERVHCDLSVCVKRSVTYRTCEAVCAVHGTWGLCIPTCAVLISSAGVCYCAKLGTLKFPSKFILHKLIKIKQSENEISKL